MKKLALICVVLAVCLLVGMDAEAGEYFRGDITVRQVPSPQVPELQPLNIGPAVSNILMQRQMEQQRQMYEEQRRRDEEERAYERERRLLELRLLRQQLHEEEAQ